MTVSGGYGNHPNDAEGRPNGFASGGLRGSGPPTSRDDRDLDDAAALVLDALTDDERSQAMQRVHRDPVFRREVAELAPVVGLLPSVLALADADRLPSTAGPVGNEIAPSGDLRARILSQVAEEAMPAAAIAPPTGARSGKRSRTTGMPGRPGAADAWAAQATLPPSRPVARSAATPSVSGARLGGVFAGNRWLTSAMAALILLLAVSAIALAIRNATLTDRVDALDQQIAQLDQESIALQNEVALANSQSNASAWVLNYDPSSGNPSATNATGTVFYSYREESVVAAITGLPPPAEGKAYQLWYLGVDGSEQPRSAGMMVYTSTGATMFNASDVVRDFDKFAVSVEPASGSEQPTTAPILMGNLSAAG